MGSSSSRHRNRRHETRFYPPTTRDPIINPIPPPDQQRDPCLFEETFYVRCKSKGHSTVRCEKAGNPGHFCSIDPPDGELQWTRTHPDFLLCPRCDDIDQAQRFLNFDKDVDRQYWMYVRERGYGFRRADHRDSGVWEQGRGGRLQVMNWGRK